MFLIKKWAVLMFEIKTKPIFENLNLTIYKWKKITKNYKKLRLLFPN